ncbi:MAG TPA: SMC family ATPase [Patescibacteria group bacterium]|nr:SMC family ATPase [Patescibacteria group bacterium]
MVPEKLQLHNFMSYQNPKSLDFKSFNLACLAGDNGVGKSSILEALSWAVWGKSRASSDDDLIFQKASEMWVEFTFQLEKSHYKILRKRIRKKRGHSELYLFSFSPKTKGYHSLSEDKILNTQKKIEKLIKIPYRVFINSAYLRQGKADEFTTKTPAERKDILADILDLEYFDDLSKFAREKSRNFQNEAKSQKYHLDELEMEMTREPEIKKSFQKSSQVFKKINLQIETVKQQRQNLEVKIKIANKINLELENLKYGLENIIFEGKKLKTEKIETEMELSQIEKLTKRRKLIHDNFERLQKLKKAEGLMATNQIQTLTLKQKTASFIADIDKIKSQIKKISHIAKCPTCLRILPKNEAGQIINNLNQEIKNQIQPKLDQIQAKIDKINYSHPKHNQVKFLIQNLASAEDDYNQLSQLEAVSFEKKKLLQKINLKIKTKKDEFIKLNSKITKLTASLNKYSEIEEKYQQISQNISELDKAHSNIREELGGLQQEIKHLESVSQKYHQLKTQLAKNQKDADIFLELAEIFSKNGIQARILDNAIPEIENQTNQILSKLSQDTMKISFETQKAKKSQDQSLIETLDIAITDNNGTRNYEMFSGGEAFRINFAIRIALSRFLAQKSGAKLQFLAIDEGFGTQDDNGRLQLVEAINAISQDFKKIIVITHILELKDAFETRIDITKDENGSHITVAY